MTVEKEKILQLESDAKRLVDNLRELHKKAGDYHAANNKLDETNTVLANLVLETEALTGQSHNIIKHINDIGSSKIFDDLESIKNDSKELLKTSESLKNRGKKQFIVTLSLLIILIIINVVFKFFPI